ncbi:hypothetical protein MBLNU457_4564t1 [Dothideomycetes sp. NU457]
MATERHSRFRSRRGSLASTTSKAPLDKEALSQVLDDIHTTASKSGTLTSFSDYDGGSGAKVGTKELVSGGISGLYSRLRQSVTGGSPESARSHSRNSIGYSETASVTSNTSSLPRQKPEKDLKNSLLSTTAPSESGQSRSAPPSRGEDKSATRDDNRLSAEISSNSDLQVPASPLLKQKPSRALDATRRDQSGLSTVTSRDFADDIVERAESVAKAQRDQLDSASADVDRISVDRPTSVKSAAVANDALDDGDALLSSDEDEDSPDGLMIMGGATAPQARQSDIVNDHKRDSALKVPTEEPTQHRPHAREESGEAPFMPSPSHPSVNAVGPNSKRAPSRIAEKSLPTVNISRASSTMGSGQQGLNKSAVSTAVSTPTAELPPNFNAGFRRPVAKTQDASAKARAVVPAHLKRRVVSKEFWMKDENARDCFYCGDAFSTFRRKHHCRTCGQIFDAKCTVLISGHPFDLPGTLRLCKPCEGVIYGSDDDSTVFTDEEDHLRNSILADRRGSLGSRPPRKEDHITFKSDDGVLATPSIGIPASRRNRESKRRSAVIEFDTHPSLARPSSSRSLKSLAGRPRSSSHKRHGSRHQGMRNSRHPFEERGPFYQDTGDGENRGLLPAFHNDNIIDPDLAPFMSDDGSEDDRASMFTVLNAGSQPSSLIDTEKAGLSNFLASAVRKGRSRLGDRSSAPQERLRDEVNRLPSRPGSKLRRRNPSIASINFARPSPRRSRSQNLLIREMDDSAISEVTRIHREPEDLPRVNLEDRIKKSAAMHGLDAPKLELNRASLQHVRKLLAQLLQDHGISHWRKWERALLPILLQCTDDVDPDVQRGDDMDIRNYVKLKKITGGRPGDTAYVSGVVFSKNVALKSMKRSFVRPRIVIVTFAIEYARYNTHFMSLEPVIAQEREYLRNLVGRIAALHPQVLLVERNVSGLAIEMLQQAGITVVYNVKESVLAAVARVTRTIMIKTVDKLSIDPSHLGHCGNFDVKTYVHSGVKKTYIFISGCQPSLGCTVVLRGSDTEELRRVKRITEFMCYVVYNLRLETCLMRDEFALIPTTTVSDEQKLDIKAIPTIKKPYDSSTDVKSEHPGPQAHAEPAAGATSSLNANAEATGQELEGDQTAADAARPEDVPIEPAEAADGSPGQDALPSQYRDLVQTSRTRLLSSSPFVKFVEPILLKQAQEQERRVEVFKRLRDAYMGSADSPNDDANEKTEFEMIQPEMAEEAEPQAKSQAMRRFMSDVHNVQYQRALSEYNSKKKQWESFFEGSNGNPFDPFTHQNIFVLQSLVSSVTSAPCAGPEVLGLSFYADFEHPEMSYEADCTLGQFIEDICSSANTSCKTCNRKILEHHRHYVHGTGQLSISVVRHPSKIKGLQNSILMWSTCKICNQETTVMPMSDNTWKYSFGKYLELSFWSTPLKPRAGLCPHDIHKEFVRCFGYQDYCVRVVYDKVELYEVLVPSSIMNWAVGMDLKLKNQLYTECATKLKAFMGSVKGRLKSINLTTVTPEKTQDATEAVERLIHQADEDHDDLLNKLQTSYMTSRFYEIVPFNQIVRAMDTKAIVWDEAFAEFERNYFPSETDIRRLATLQLKKLFLDRHDTAHGDASDIEEGVEMKERPHSDGMRLTDEELQSEKAQNMLTAVIEEHINSDNRTLLPETNSADVESNDGLTPLNSVQSHGLSVGETERDVDREDVKHLDLAVSQLSPEQDSASSVKRSSQVLLARTDQQEDTNASVTEPKPLNPTLIERIEQMRSAAANNAAADNVDSKIPRLADLQKKPAGANQPLLVRAQSQPVHIPSRSTDTVNIPIMESENSNESSDVESIGSGSRGLGDLSRGVEQRLIERLSAGQRPGKSTASLIPRSVPSKAAQDNSTRVSALAKHFEQLSREFERERLRERRLRAARSRQNRANHTQSSQPTVEVYKDASEAVNSRPDDKKSQGSRLHGIKLSGSHNRDQSQPTERDYAQPLSDPIVDQNDLTDADMTDADATDAEATDTDAPESIINTMTSDTDAEMTDAELAPELKTPKELDAGTSLASTLLSPSSHPDMDLPLPKHEKSSLMKMLSSFWSERSASGWLPLEYPLHQTEHVFDDSDIIVREDEPSSVIALALSSNDYLKKLKDFRATPKRRGHSQQPSRDETQGNDEAYQQAAIEASLISETGTHMKYSFGHNQVKAQCKIFYAESFDALRRKCGVSERFVESLSRSIKWDSKGGKTKSLFLKTLDDRFVIKSLQEVELKAFTRFAPDYFAFMSHTLFHGVPSVIAKMFGLFQVMIKNPATGVEFSSYLLVMENLFYDRKPTRRFDLKGSMRNRKIESTGQPDEVLLDENLVETIFETPLFVREHARKLVKASVWNDTMWLCKQNVMDYSLMAGFDDTSRQLTIGIIDCIRTYTWDKKLESWIKDRGKNKPTITSPKDYRNRFRVSMMQYVLQAPNVYHEFSRQLPAASLKMVEEAVEMRRRGIGRDGQEEEVEEFRPENGGFIDEAAMREMGSVMV